MLKHIVACSLLNTRAIRKYICSGRGLATLEDRHIYIYTYQIQSEVTTQHQVCYSDCHKWRFNLL